jgi:hypothetical protein
MLLIVTDDGKLLLRLAPFVGRAIQSHLLPALGVSGPASER